MNRFVIREHGSSILVSALSAAFGVSLLQVTGNLAVLLAADDVTGSSKTVALMLGIVAIVFIVISTYVGAIVTANTFATIIAGRTRSIALMRLIGSTAAAQRRAVAKEGLLVGVIGVVIGAVVGTLTTLVTVLVAVGTKFIPDLPYTYFEPVLLVPVVGVILTTWIASWVGSRRVLLVSPMQATGAAQEASREEAAGHRGRNAAAIALFVIGVALLALGIVVGFINPAGVLIGVVGGVVSFSGLILGAQLVMPPALRFVGRLLGSSPSARLAAENAVRYPERSSRTTIGLVIGVTLVTTFAVAVGSFQRIIEEAQRAQPEIYQGTDQTLLVVVTIFSVLIGFSALIAAVGMVNNLSLSVLQRTRELGLLRALGFTARQLRAMIRAEAAQLTIAAILVGLVLGIFYGWAGAQSLLGTINGAPGLVVPVVPLWLLAVVAVSAAVLTVVASVAPTRRATCIAPVVALAVD
ncbi:MAG: transporter permease [Rhodoglobus sp.]|nr:transporter permease [Rhodoglobus sp.]